jgi:hypothetical protein
MPGHASVASLAKYARLSVEALARSQERNDRRGAGDDDVQDARNRRLT